MKLEGIEGKMLRHDQAECPTLHTFGPGLYVREVRMPAGALVMGHHQIFDQMNIFVKGKVLMLNDDGSKMVLTAPQIFTGKPGRKIGYVIEDVIWLNVYPTDERDVDTLESTYLRKSDVWKRDQIRRIDDNGDYQRTLLELSVTEDEVREQTENEDDQIPLPFGTYKMGIFDSPIEGKGVFATADIEEGETIAPARIGDKRTPVGRYTNHSDKPNAKMDFVGDDVYLVSISKIKGCLGGQLGDEITTNYKHNIELIRSQSCQVLQRQ